MSSSIRQWLETLRLSQYADRFEANDIDLEVMPSMHDQDLEKLGVSMGHRKRLLSAIADLNGAPSSVLTRASPVVTVAPIGPSLPSFAATEGERRQLTVMFCDLVDSTALSERLDPEELRSLLHDYRTQCGEVISRYEGFVARYVGDGILTYFGWPTAHEDDAERALRAALEIVYAVKGISSAEPLSVRIGIATGPVVVGEQAGVGDQSKLAVGSTPNLAARLQGLAAADQIVIASATRRLVGNSFELSDLGKHELKGIAEPVNAWRVMGVRAAASRFDAATQGWVTPLVGREQEIELLLDRWQQAQDGEGQLVLLSGEPGIGKSRILSVLHERLEAQGARTLRFQCSPYHVNSAFYPSIDHFERALKVSRVDTAESKLDRLEALMVGYNGLPLSDVRFVAAMLSIPCDERYGTLAMTPQKFKDETLRTLVDLTEAAARKQTTVMLFEDAHWADPTSIEVLDLLIDRVRNIPLLIVLTHRPEFQPKWSSHGHVMALNLSKLTRAQSSAIVSEIASGKALPAELLGQILIKTDGVPLYVEEFTKAILESGELKDEGDHYDYGGTGRTVTIPATLRDSLMARLDRSAQAKEIAQIGAAIGREFTYEVIAAVASHTRTELESALTQLIDSGLAFRQGRLPETTYTFKHALVQDAAYDSLLKSRRQALHTKIAHVLEETFPTTKDTEPELLAHHLTAAGLVEAAIGYWQKAATLAITRLALKEAISHLNRAMEIIDTLPQSPERDGKELGLRVLLGTAWVALRGFAASEVWASLYPALALARSLSRLETLVPIYYGLYISVVAQGRAAESLDWVNEMLASAEGSGDRDLLIVGHRAACSSYYWLGDFNLSREHGDRVLALYSEQHHRHLADIMNVDPKTSVGIHVILGTWILGFPDRAAELSDANDVHARRRGHPFDLGHALTVGCWLWDFRGEPGRILARIAEAERLGRAHSLPFISEVLAKRFKGLGLLRAGRLAEGILTLRSTLEKGNVSGVRMPYFQAILGEGLALSGDIEGGLRLIDDGLTQIARPGWEERWSLAELLRLKGWMHQLQEKFTEAEENFLASVDVAREQHAKSWELRSSISLARLRQSQGNRMSALSLLKPVYDWFTEGYETKDLKDAKVLLDELDT